MFSNVFRAVAATHFVIFVSAFAASAQQTKAPDAPPDWRFACKFNNGTDVFPISIWISQQICSDQIPESDNTAPCNITADQVDWPVKNITFKINRRNGHLVAVLPDQSVSGLCTPAALPLKDAAPKRKADFVYSCAFDGFTKGFPISVWVAENMCEDTGVKEATRCSISEERVHWPIHANFFEIDRKQGKLFAMVGDTKIFGTCTLTP